MMNAQLLTKKTWILALMVVGGLSLVWLIPNSGKFRESRLIEELPKELVDRVGVELDISALERKTLAPDTTFTRKRYFIDEKLSDPPIDVSVVFSGKDINNSIHRPEVCLEAQGYSFLSEKYITIDVGEGLIPFKEIVCARARVATDGVLDKNSKGETIVDTRIQYYTFVGAETIVAGHYERTWEDIKMRLLKGTDQQWAYITISMDVTEGDKEDTGWAKYFNNLNVEQVKAALIEFQTVAMPLLLKS